METLPVSTPENINDDDVDDEDEDESSESVSEKDNRKEQGPVLFGRKVDKKIPKKPDVPITQAKERFHEGTESDTLSEEEVIIAAEELVRARLEEIKDEPAEAEMLANIALLEKIQAKVSEGEAPNAKTLDESFAETAEELGIETPEPLSDAASEAVPVAPENSAADQEAANTDSDDEAEATVTQPTASPGPPTPPAPPAALNHAAGGGTVPPNLPPVLPPRNPGGNTPPFIPPIPGVPSNNANVAPTVFTGPNQTVNVIERHSAALPYLIVGYLLGRRRGRTKTEKKLLPIQRKLEKEVAQLQDNITSREEKIRSLVREQVAGRPAVAERFTEHAEKRKQPVAPAERLERTKRPEELGRLAVISERPEKVPPPEATPIRRPAEIIKVPERPKSVDSMTIPELLLIAAHIPIEQSTIKRLYDTHRLNDDGLRRVTQAYLRGERYEKTFHENQSSPEPLVMADNSELLPMDLPQKNLPKTNTDSSIGMPVNPALSDNHPIPIPSPQQSHSVSPPYVSRPKSAAPKTVAIAAVCIIAVLILLFLLH